MPTIVSMYSKAHWLRPAFAESCWLLRVTLSKELVAVHVWNAPDQWHNWQVAEVRTAPSPAELNVKTGLLPSLYFGICYSFGFSRLLFFLRFGKSDKLRQTNSNEFVSNFVMKKVGQNLFNCLLCYVQPYLIRWLQLFISLYVFQ